MNALLLIPLDNEIRTILFHPIDERLILRTQSSPPVILLVEMVGDMPRKIARGYIARILFMYNISAVSQFKVIRLNLYPIGYLVGTRHISIVVLCALQRKVRKVYWMRDAADFYGTVCAEVPFDILQSVTAVILYLSCAVIFLYCGAGIKMELISRKLCLCDGALPICSVLNLIVPRIGLSGKSIF